MYRSECQSHSSKMEKSWIVNHSIPLWRDVSMFSSTELQGGCCPPRSRAIKPRLVRLKLSRWILPDLFDRESPFRPSDIVQKGRSPTPQVALEAREKMQASHRITLKAQYCISSNALVVSSPGDFGAVVDRNDLIIKRKRNGTKRRAGCAAAPFGHALLR